MDKSELSIIIVSWNVKDLLRQCLRSIFLEQGSLNLEIIVVDNASKDQTVEMVKKEFPQIKVIANINNLGFARANNQGIKESQGDFILVLNPDTKIIKNSLATMLNFIKQNPKIGIAGCKHLNPDLTWQPSVRRFPGVLAIFLILTKIAKLFPNLPPLYYYFAKDLNFKTAQPVEQIAGSFFLIRKETLKKIGLFDEKFFLWFEEVDLCKRAQNASWQIWYNPSATIIHYGGQSFNQKLTWQKQKLFFQSAWYYFRKHGFRIRH